MQKRERARVSMSTLPLCWSNDKVNYLQVLSFFSCSSRHLPTTLYVLIQVPKLHKYMSTQAKLKTQTQRTKTHGGIDKSRPTVSYYATYRLFCKDDSTKQLIFQALHCYSKVNNGCLGAHLKQICYSSISIRSIHNTCATRVIHR